MRSYGAQDPTELVPISPDTVGVAVVSSAAAVVAQDWPSGAQMVTFGSTMGFFFNSNSTSVNIPSTNQAGATGSSDINEYCTHGLTRQILSDSTGYSITAPTSGVITLSFWRK